MRTDPARTPILVGIAMVTQRAGDWRAAAEPLDLMLQEVRQAGVDAAGTAGAPALLAGIDWLAVPRGRWKYADAGRAVARDCGAPDAFSVLASVGVAQQTLIADACERIVTGASHTTLVTGADTGYRLQRAQIAGQRATEREAPGTPDLYLEPAEDLRHPVEVRAGLRMPVGLYAMVESAWRSHHGWSVDAHRDRLAELYAGFSRIAAANPHAWNRKVVSAAEIREPGPRNPLQAFPYMRYHCSTWNVDQASALLFCSAARAMELGIPPERWIHVRGSSESHHMAAVSTRAQLHRCVGAELAGQAGLEAVGWTPADIDLVDLYSCFPVAVETYAAALGLAPDQPLTVTGGMAFAGGPYNNYQLHATCRVAELLRAGHGRNAVVSCVSGVLTKQGFGMYSRDPGPAFSRLDLTDVVAAATCTLPVQDAHDGPAVVAGYTVVQSRSEPARGIVLVDTPAGARALATTDDAVLIARLQAEECVGARVRLRGHELLSLG